MLLLIKDYNTYLTFFIYIVLKPTKPHNLDVYLDSMEELCRS